MQQSKRFKLQITIIFNLILALGYYRKSRIVL